MIEIVNCSTELNAFLSFLRTCPDRGYEKAEVTPYNHDPYHSNGEVIVIGIKFTRRFIIDGVPYRIDQLPKAQVTKERALKTETERVDLAMAIYNFERKKAAG